MNLNPADRRKLLPTLDELARAVEELLLGGLTTATEATRQAFNVSFQEASRLGLLRLGSTLRQTNEELGRFTRNDPEFSRKRLTFFLNRAWLLCHGLTHALRANDDAEFDRLLWVPASKPVDRLEVVTIGVSKKVTSAFVAFEFRLRAVKQSGPISAGQRLTWAAVFPVKPGANIPAEAYLHLPQKQKFVAAVFLEGKTIIIEKAAASLDGHSGRIGLGDASTVTAGEPFSDWHQFQTWDISAAIERIRAHKPGPLDLDVELQEEIILTDWRIDKPSDSDDGPIVFPLTWREIPFDVIVARGAEGVALKKTLEELRKNKQRPPLFGLLHYERCRLILQPLAIFGDNGPQQLMLSEEKIDRAALLKALKF